MTKKDSFVILASQSAVEPEVNGSNLSPKLVVETIQDERPILPKKVSNELKLLQAQNSGKNILILSCVFIHSLTHTHTQTHTHMFIYMCVCVCVCVNVCVCSNEDLQHRCANTNAYIFLCLSFSLSLSIYILFSEYFSVSPSVPLCPSLSLSLSVILSFSASHSLSLSVLFFSLSLPLFTSVYLEWVNSYIYNIYIHIHTHTYTHTHILICEMLT